MAIKGVHELKAKLKAKEMEATKAVRLAAITAFREIVIRTPVGNTSLWKSSSHPKGYTGGRLRGNWQVSIDVDSSASSSVIDTSGHTTAKKGASKINQFSEKNRKIIFTNNLPYAERVEDGWSKQRPRGMVKGVVAMWDELLKKAARKVMK